MRGLGINHEAHDTISKNLSSSDFPSYAQYQTLFFFLVSKIRQNNRKRPQNIYHEGNAAANQKDEKSKMLRIKYDDGFQTGVKTTPEKTVVW
ncbi:hypothetical protein AVEN_271667-1 [Araneus ventricosus]|uniref:Uncharacterized protein n=1 Tax=Araneus ventricosus TaxID=182803 RepID=A0A4Y2MDK3_ARAVE|nr:hypothetical protein AVEN_271667-1 [Araneus ventricosus]